MVPRRLETDYLVVGCGAAGMAFTDSLIADSDADVIMVDRRHAPGGHWNDGIPRIERDTIVLDHGTIPTSPGSLHVHCAAPGLNRAPSVPMFTADRITLQPIRAGLIPFNAALVGYVEATRDDLADKNRLCPPNRLPDVPLHWVRGTLIARPRPAQPRARAAAAQGRATGPAGAEAVRRERSPGAGQADAVPRGGPGSSVILIL